MTKRNDEMDEMNDEEAKESIKAMLSEIYSKDEYFLVYYNIKGSDVKYIVPLTDGDTFDVLSHRHEPVPANQMVKCACMDIVVDISVGISGMQGLEESGIVEELPYYLAKQRNMYILPQEVK